MSVQYRCSLKGCHKLGQDTAERGISHVHLTSHTQAAALADAQQRVFGGALAYAVVRRWGDVERYPHCPMVDTRRRPLTSARSSSQTRLQAAPPAVADSQAHRAAPGFGHPRPLSHSATRALVTGQRMGPVLHTGTASRPTGPAPTRWRAGRRARCGCRGCRPTRSCCARGPTSCGRRATARTTRRGSAAHFGQISGSRRRSQRGRARPGQPQASATSSASQAGMEKLIGPATKWALLRHMHYRRATPSPSAWRGCSDTSARRRSAIGCSSGRCFYPSPTPPMHAWMHAPFPSIACSCAARRSSRLLLRLPGQEFERPNAQGDVLMITSWGAYERHIALPLLEARAWVATGCHVMAHSHVGSPFSYPDALQANARPNSSPHPVPVTPR